MLREGLLDVSKAVPSAVIPGRRTQLFSIAFALLVLLGFAVPVAQRLSGYVVRSTFRHATGYNEGWNTYYSDYAATGRPLYGAPPDRLAANYPPLSFHLEGALGRVTGNLNFAGRILSLAALLWVALCAGFTVHRLSSDPGPRCSRLLRCLVLLFRPPASASMTRRCWAMGSYSPAWHSAASNTRRCSPLPVSSSASEVHQAQSRGVPIAITLDILLRSRRRLRRRIGTAAVTACLLAS